MNEANMYLNQILQKYNAKDLAPHTYVIAKLKSDLITWANTCYLGIYDSGSRAKGTAISIASDVDYLISLTSDCNENTGGLKACYDSLFAKLNEIYYPVKKQNVSVRLILNGLSIDVTPARKQNGNTNYHNLHVSKSVSWKQTNIQKHINDISQSGRTNEIKLLKIWRELNKLDFPSIYLEYLLVDNILFNKTKDASKLTDNVWHVFKELAKTQGNPLFEKIVDPANSNNILSDLMTTAEKNIIINYAQVAIKATDWSQIFW